VVGAGAAGLVAARELLREGHAVTVFEQVPPNKDPNALLCHANVSASRSHQGMCSKKRRVRAKAGGVRWPSNAATPAGGAAGSATACDKRQPRCPSNLPCGSRAGPLQGQGTARRSIQNGTECMLGSVAFAAI
jgi:NAD(P)-binding Rossmann-like domain